VSEHTYLVTCWNCLGEFDAVPAVWCSDDPKDPTKLCPFCLRCFCDASGEYKQQFWRHAPAPLVDELQTLSQSQDRLGDILIRMKKITTPQLLEVLIEQKETGRKLGEILVRQQLVSQTDVDVGLRMQGVNTLKDTRAGVDTGRVYWEHSSPEGTLDYLLALGARKRASDVTFEPQPEQVAVRYRIDGFAFRVDPIPKAYAPTLEQAIFAMFDLDPARRATPLSSRTSAPLEDAEYDMILRTVPGPHGVGATIKLVNRSTFIKDLTTLGLELEDRVRVIEEIRSGLGLLLVTSPAFNGSGTTFYAIMNAIADGQKDVLSIEAPIHWVMEGVRQVEADSGPEGPRMEASLRALVAVRPEVLMLAAVPDPGTAVVAAQIASSRLVVAAMTAPSAATGLANLRDLGVPPALLAGSLGLVTGQCLVRALCRICSEPAEPPAARTLAAHGIDDQEAQTLRFFRGKGCPTCNRVGYRGRRALFELLPASPEVRAVLGGGDPAPGIEEAALGSGMISVRERCLALVREGVTSFDEFARLRL
jgi:type IV pilus assembly protein PilB